MIRMIGALLLTAGAGALGMGAVWHLNGRVHDLRGLVAGLEAMKRVMAARLEPIEGMLSAAVQSTDGYPRQFYAFCLREAAHLNGRHFFELWETALETVPFRLEETDVSELRQVGSVLGRFDEAHQLSALEKTVDRLERLLDEAKEERKRMGRVYGTLGVSAGLFLVILLL